MLPCFNNNELLIDTEVAKSNTEQRVSTIENPLCDKLMFLECFLYVKRMKRINLSIVLN